MAETISLGTRLDTSAASALLGDLTKLPGDSEVVLDAEQVTHFGGLTLQVVLSAARHFKVGGGSIALTNLSERAEGQLAAMGVSSNDLMEMAV